MKGRAMPGRRLVATGALLCASCVHQAQVVSHGAPPAGATALPARQTTNAADAGEGDSEMRSLRQRLAADPRDLEARLSLARRYAEMGLPDLALEHYRLAAAQFPDSPVVALELAKTLRAMGEPAAALAAAQAGEAKQASGNWQLLSLEGILEDDQGDRRAAEAAHRAALEIEPKRAALHNNLGYNLYLQGRYREAVEEFRRAIALDAACTAAHNNLAAALARGDAPATAEALAEWQRTDGAAAAHNNLAAVRMEQGRWAEARAELEEALKYQRNFPPALANLRRVALRDGQPILASPAAARSKPAAQAADAGRTTPAEAAARQ
jgi:Flp pilus assembly protein TadD